MRVIDFLQFIKDFDKKIPFYYQLADEEKLVVTGIVENTEQLVIETKKAKSHPLHQWELLTLLNVLNDKTKPVVIKIDQTVKPLYGMQITPDLILLR